MKVLTTIFLLLLTGEIISCSCINNVDSVKTSFESADLALKGEVISKLFVDNRDTTYDINEEGDTIRYLIMLDPNNYVEFTIAVEEYYKGGIQKDTIKVRGPLYSSCMANLDSDGTYFVFAYLTKDNIFYSEYCSGNKKYNPQDQRILKKLKKEKKPAHNTK